MSRCPRCGMERADAMPPPMSEPPSPVLPVSPSAVPSVSAPNASAPTMTVPLSRAPTETTLRAAAETAAHTGALPFRAGAAQPDAEAPPAFPPRTTVVPFEGQRRRALMKDEAAIAPPPDSIFTSPPDEVRRFPLFTRGQWTLVGAGAALLALALLVWLLLWSRAQKDASQVIVTPAATAQATTDQALPNPAPTVDLLSASPTPELAPMLEGDQALYAEVKKALAAYNPIYHARYQVAVKDGVVTLTGPADNQPEKEGISNVLRLVAGVKGLANNLTVKADVNAALTGLPPTATTNPAAVQSTAPTVTPAPENNLANQQAALEAERQRLAREAEAQRQRESEFQRQREEEQSRQRIVPVAPANAAPPVTTTTPRVLRSGTVAWSGIVDGVDEIIIAGSTASVRHRSGEAVREPRAAFSAPVPRAPVNVKLLNASGRGELVIVQEPAAANGYTTIVRLDDTRENGGKPYQFTLRWTAE